MEIYYVFKNNIKRSYHNTFQFILLLLLPAIILLCSNVVGQMSKPSIRLGILYEEKNPAYHQVMKSLNQSKGITFQKAKEESLHTDLILGTYQYIIDLREVHEIKNLKILSYASDSSIRKITNQIKRSVESGNKVQLSVNNKGDITESERICAYLFTVFIITATINACILIKDRKEGMLRRFGFAPTKIYSYITGNTVFNLVVAVCQIVIVYGVIILFHIPVYLNIIHFLIIMSAIIFFSISMATFVCSISKSDLSANVLSSCVALLFTLLGGGFIGFYKMPFILQKVGSISPVHWIINSVGAMEDSKDNLPLTSIFLLIGVSIVLYLGSIKKLSKNVQ
ncbi:ABC transporter permease [Anaeromicropila herbilytica]|uniref:ABC-2 type transporter transmembrane domain-containing protein n=1 Tax=Anaeromicropila herbilytica TaxID=2785025 RepID=A0A7R7EJB3_9FIRM|nr:ABC transporter permease [Anaeromicropila herbilytica]BCN29492.1 hypothetical protein bsdtb5_07870 [Anaeromicropila herbilytica]